MKLELFYPLKNPFFVSQKFGENLVPLYRNLGMLGHNGWDIVGQYGQIIRAAHDGIVTFTGEDGSAGLGVVIRTEDERDYKDGKAFFKTIYWHCEPNSFLVKPGDKVRVGDAIARCDTTGLAQGSHLHFGLKPMKQGEADWEWYNIEQNSGYFGAIDPAPYWSKLYAEDMRSMLDRFAIIKSILDNLKKVVSSFIGN